VARRVATGLKSGQMTNISLYSTPPAYGDGRLGNVSFLCLFCCLRVTIAHSCAFCFSWKSSIETSLDSPFSPLLLNGVCCLLRLENRYDTITHFSIFSLDSPVFSCLYLLLTSFHVLSQFITFKNTQNFKPYSIHLQSLKSRCRNKTYLSRQEGPWL